MSQFIVSIEFGNYKWEAVYNPKTNQWKCQESQRSPRSNLWEPFNTYMRYDDEINQEVEHIFAIHH